MGHYVNDKREGLEIGFPKEFFSFLDDSMLTESPGNNRILSGYGREVMDYASIEPSSVLWMIYDPRNAIGKSSIIDSPPYFSSGVGDVTLDFYRGYHNDVSYDSDSGTEAIIKNLNDNYIYAPTESKWYYGVDEPTGTFSRTGGIPIGIRSTNQNAGGNSVNIEHLQVKNTDFVYLFKIQNHSEEKTRIGWKYLFFEITPKLPKLERIVV
jgi:hypothetical protein